MSIVAALFLVVASICGLLAAPALFLYLYHTFPDTWWAEVAKIQALAGASVALFAASLGTIGVLLTIWNQRRNLEKQLSAQRNEQELVALQDPSRVTSDLVIGGRKNRPVTDQASVGDVFPPAVDCRNTAEQ
jgi:hypothetical protein